MKTLLMLFPLMMVSCLPNRLVPHDYTIEKHNLEAFVELDSVTVSLVNLEVKSDHYVFGLGISNQSSKPIFLDIKKIRKQAHALSFRQDHSSEYLMEVVAAMSPKQVNQFF